MSAAPDSPEVYMRDKVFTGKLAAERTAQRQLMREYGAIAGKMKAMVEAKKAEMKTTDLSRVKAALENDPVWTNLYAQCVRAKDEIEAHRRTAFGVVRERLAGGKKQEISK